MARTVSIGGLTYDLFVDIAHEVVTVDDRPMLQLPLGSKIRIRAVTGTCGGGASNTSVGLARLGCGSLCCGVVGSDQWGEQLLKNLQKEGVDTKSVTVVEGEPSSFSIIVIAKTGERVILNTPGTNAHLHDVTFDRDAALTADWVYLNHLHSSSHVIEDDIVTLLTSTHPPHLTWNPGGHQIEAGLDAKDAAALVAQTDLLLFNKEEALIFTRTENIDTALHALVKAGCGITCITDGANGATASDRSMSYYCPSIKGPVVDTTGAGDAFGTGMTWGLLTGQDLPTALRAGTINAMSVVGAVGAQPGLLTETQMHSKIATTDLTVTSLSLPI